MGKWITKSGKHIYIEDDDWKPRDVEMREAGIQFASDAMPSLQHKANKTTEAIAKSRLQSRLRKRLKKNRNK